MIPELKDVSGLGIFQIDFGAPLVILFAGLGDLAKVGCTLRSRASENFVGQVVTLSSPHDLFANKVTCGGTHIHVEVAVSNIRYPHRRGFVDVPRNLRSTASVWLCALV